MDTNNPTTKNEPAKWHLHTLDAWRELRAEREARIEAERDRDVWRKIAQEALHMLAEVTPKMHRALAIIRGRRTA